MLSEQFKSISKALIHAICILRRTNWGNFYQNKTKDWIYIYSHLLTKEMCHYIVVDVTSIKTCTSLCSFHCIFCIRLILLNTYKKWHKWRENSPLSDLFWTKQDYMLTTKSTAKSQIDLSERKAFPIIFKLLSSDEMFSIISSLEAMLQYQIYDITLHFLFFFLCNKSVLQKKLDPQISFFSDSANYHTHLSTV